MMNRTELELNEKMVGSVNGGFIIGDGTFYKIGPSAKRQEKGGADGSF